MSSLWLPSAGPLYLPPAKPTARVLRTDEYVTGTDVYFHAGSDRLLIVGHPYFNVYTGNDNNKRLSIPKVSSCQYRVFHCKLPDPNRFALIDQKLYNPDRERLVWKFTGMEIGRGGPLGISSTGHPLYNKIRDTENPNQYPGDGAEQRMDFSMDPKQVQLFIVGCAPATGEYWDVAKKCEEGQKGDCPAIQLVNSTIQDGDMGDIGFGAANFKALQEDRSSVSLDLVDTFSIWPDYLRMTKDIYGDSLFFHGRREQQFARHLWARAGTMGDAIPESNYLHPAEGSPQETNLGSHIYFPTASGSLASSDNNLFNTSNATRCHLPEENEESPDPYAKMNFWTVDLQERFSSDLSQHALGRKFLYQIGLLNGKRPRTAYAEQSGTKTVKRKRTK